MKKLTTTILGTLLLFSASSVYALTSQDIEILIAAGLIAPDKVDVARAAVGTSSSKQTTAKSLVAGTNKDGCLRLSTNIVEGVGGSAVSSLQTFLKNQGHFDYPEITGYFGQVTRKAVEKFQVAHSIVSDGTPETTGFGSVGPATRKKIIELTCVDGVSSSNGNDSSDSSSGTFFGYNLDELLNYEPDFEFETEDSSGNFNFEYEPNFDYNLEDNFSFNFDYEPNFNYEGLSKNNDNSTSGKIVDVKMSVKDKNNNFIDGARGSRNILVATRTIEIRWESEYADSCSLNGDFPERSLSIPVSGNASVFLVNPSYTLPTTGTANDYGLSGKPLFGISIYCEENGVYGSTASDAVFVHIDETI